MKSVKLLSFVVFCLALVIPAAGQYRDLGFEVGIHGGATFDLSTGINEPTGGGIGGIDLAFPILPSLQGEISISYAELLAESTHTLFIPGDFKLKLAPVSVPGFIPYLFAGAGAINYRHDDQPKLVAPGTDETGWAFFVPAGVGFQFRIFSRAALDLRGTYNYVVSPHLTPDPDEDDDAFATVLAGIRFSSGGTDKDPDNDGLLSRDERRIGTDPRNPDTDGDGLNDGEEHRQYNTNPLVPDTDGDGLADGAEVRTHNTDPLNPDTDGDGLRDGDEVLQYTTNPLKADTDDDGLSDGDEVLTHRTDPKKVDSDNDRLSDGEEVNRHRTNPLKMDTDDGTVADGLEIEQGTNPLDPSDDVRKPQIIIFERDKPVVLPGIQFDFNKATIKPESEAILIQAYNSLLENSEVVVEISGHTDAIGSDSYNQKLSERRAQAVRQWMIAKGIDPSRMTAVGYGESRPIASNDTDEGRQQNRRIEFKRTN